MIVDQGDVVSIEQSVRELTGRAMDAARERAASDDAVKAAAAELENAKTELPAAERKAKGFRQAQNDAIRGRAELEQRLADIIETEDVTRARRLQADQRSQGFRAAAAFAGSGRAEAEAAGDRERAERERLVEDRAAREAANAEARAAEELAEETKLGRLRVEIEAHVEAERALESGIAADRTSAEARVTALRDVVERASFTLHEAQVNLERIDADCERIAGERAVADDHLREVGARARVEIEARIADLRAQETQLANERSEQERLLAALLENERRIVAEPEPQAEAQPSSMLPHREPIHMEFDEPGSDASGQDAMPARDATPAYDATPAHDTTHSFDAVPAYDRTPAYDATPMYSLVDDAGEPDEDDVVASNGVHSGRVADVVAKPDAEAPQPEQTQQHFSTVKFTASPSTPREAGPATSPTESEADRGPGFRSIIGNIFTRRKVEEPVDDEGPSIADRIARDFGLLGGEEEAHSSVPPSGAPADPHPDAEG